MTTITKPADIHAAVSALLKHPQFAVDIDTRPPQDLTVEQQIRKYVEEGPGFLREYIDVKVDFGLQAPIRPREWDGERWVKTDHPAAIEAFRSIIGPQGQDLDGLTAMMIEEAEQLGKFGLALADGPNGLTTWVLALGHGEFYDVKPPRRSNSDPEDQGSLVWPLRRGLKFQERNWDPTKPDDDFVGFPRGDVQQVFMGSARFPGEADIPLRPILSDLRRFVNAARALHRGTASQLLLANLLWFEGNAKDIADLAAGLAAPGKEIKGMSSLAQQLLMLIEAGSRSMEDYKDNDMISVMPYPIIGDGAKPETIEVGRIIDAAILDVKEDALKDIARGLSIPQDYILHGPGSGQRLFNQRMLDPAARQRSIRFTRLAAEGVTNIVYRPILERLKPSTMGGRKPTDFALQPDTSRLEEGEPPELKDLIEMAKLGMITAEGVVAKAHMQEYALELPDGVTPYDHWALTAGVARNRAATASILTPYN